MPHTLLFGGSFDPVHVGHLTIARRAAEILRASRVLFIPAQVSPHKPDAPPIADGRHRLAMLQLATRDDPLFGVCDMELNRPPPSYTFDTLQTLRQRHPGEHFTLLIGSDQLSRLPAWRHAAELLAGVPVAVLPRPGYAVPLSPSPTYSAEVWAKLRSAVLATPVLDISSTLIRRRVREELPIHDLVPPPVAAYITEHGLYR